MKIVWTKKAEQQSYRTAQYCAETFGKHAAYRWQELLEKVEACLANNPLMGKREPLLAKHKREYRSLVIHNRSKMIYYIQGDTLYISHLWDTRREPATLVRHIR